MNVQIKFSVLQSYTSVEEALIDILKISKNRLKKNALSKNFLTKAVRVKDELSIGIDLVNWREINSDYQGLEPTLIYEDTLFLVFNKKYNTHTHPLIYSENDTLLNWLALQHPHLLNVMPDKNERGLLYRLDYETSGLLIYVKENVAHSYLREKFQNIVKEKYYLCICQGKPEDAHYVHYLTESGEKGHMMKVSKEQVIDSLMAELDLKVIEYLPEKKMSLCLIKLGQGHRHQIRCQLSFIGHPILGDKLYGGDQSERLYLHAFSYHFKYNEQTYQFTANAAELFENFFDLNSCFEMLENSGLRF
jgi:23S rRNA pseudouridine1911/1915/1917 synthase